MSTFVKSCCTNFAPDLEKNKTEQKRDSRRRLVEHLALVHVAEYRALADQLQVTPGPKLDKLLFEVLENWLILKAKRELSVEK